MVKFTSQTIGLSLLTMHFCATAVFVSGPVLLIVSLYLFGGDIMLRIFEQTGSQTLDIISNTNLD